MEQSPGSVSFELRVLNALRDTRSQLDAIERRLKEVEQDVKRVKNATR
jgi:hypothetical protein